MRPALPPALRRLWRDRETLQLGRPPGPAVVLAGLDDGARTAVSLLDGTRDEEQLRRQATAAGCPPERLAVLLRLLAGAGVLRDGWPPRAAPRARPPESDRLRAEAATHAGAAAGRRRAGARVQLLGAGRVGALLAQLLTTAGVGALDVVDDGAVRPQDTGVGGLDLADVGRPRGAAVRDLLSRGAPACDLSAGAAHLAVLCPADGEPADPLRAALHAGRPHLVAEVRDGTGVVGPLVVPGATACLRCLDLARADRDPDWPRLAVQLSRPARAPAGDVLLSAAVAVQAAAQLLALVDGESAPAALDGTLELGAPGARWRRRSWSPHPDCGCVARWAL